LYGGVGEMFSRIAAERPELLLAPGLNSSGAPWGWGEYNSAVLVSIIGFTVWPHLFMKAFTARDEKTIKRTVVLYPTFQIFLVPLFLIGFAGVFFEPAPDHPNQLLPHMLMNMELPALLVGLFCAGGLAASMSSGDAMVHSSASIAVRDGMVRALGMQLDSTRQRTLIRIAVVVLLALSYVVSIVYRGDLVYLLLAAYGPIVQFAPAVVATLYWRRATGAGVLAGLIGGGGVNLLFFLWPDLRPFELHAGLYGLAVNLVLLIAVSLGSTRSLSDSESEFLATASGE